MAGEESKPREPLNSASARKKKGFVTKVKESLTITKRELKKLKKRRCYHCCMQNRSTGRPCPGTRINSSDIFKHLRRDLHFGPYYDLKSTGGNLPEGVSLCPGDPCDLCERLEDLPPDQQVSE